MGSNQRHLWDDPKFQEELPIESINIMRTCLDFYNRREGGFKNDVEDTFKKSRKLMIDSGGYNLLKKKDTMDYPYSVLAYHRFLERVNPTIAVSMDHNLSVILERDGIDVYEEQKIELFEKTIDNFVLQYEMKRSYELMIAIQGVPIEDKRLFLHMLDKKIPLNLIERFGYGGRVEPSICGLLIRYIRKKAPNYKFHMLGATYSDLKDMLAQGIEFHSFDTITWLRGIQFGGKTFDDDGNVVLIKKTSQTTTEVQRRWMKYHYFKVMKLIKKYDKLNKKQKGMF
jgi:hypothetical protein